MIRQVKLRFFDFAMRTSTLYLRNKNYIIVGNYQFPTGAIHHLLYFIQRSLEQNGDNRSWSTIRRIMQTHRYITVVFLIKNGTVYRIRKAGTPDLRQQAICETIDVKWIDLPCTRTVFDSKSEASL